MLMGADNRKVNLVGLQRSGLEQFFAARGGVHKVRELADYAIARHYPDIADEKNPYLAFFEAVIDAQAALVAGWMNIGFIHGVMNTDNTSIAGETIDYGPCAFMDSYHPDTVYSSIDHRGRYAYGNQPSIAQWNLAGLANALLPLIADDEDSAVRAGVRHRLLENRLQNLGRLRDLGRRPHQLGPEEPSLDQER